MILTERDFCPLTGCAARARNTPKRLPVRARKALRRLGVDSDDPEAVRDALIILAGHRNVGPSTMRVVREWLDLRDTISRGQDAR